MFCISFWVYFLRCNVFSESASCISDCLFCATLTFRGTGTDMMSKLLGRDCSKKGLQEMRKVYIFYTPARSVYPLMRRKNTGDWMETGQTYALVVTQWQCRKWIRMNASAQRWRTSCKLRWMCGMRQEREDDDIWKIIDFVKKGRALPIKRQCLSLLPCRADRRPEDVVTTKQ